MADHKYIRREGTRGNYKYIYEDDLKNVKNYYNSTGNNNRTFTLGPNGTTVPVNNMPQKKVSNNPFAGVGKAMSSGLKSAGNGISKGMTSVSNKARRDVKILAINLLWVLMVP